MARSYPFPFYSYQIGQFELILLSEKQTVCNHSFFKDLPPELTEEKASREFPCAINGFLLKTPESLYLFDTGSGDKVLNRLDELNISLNKIKKVFITHMHSDHIGGLTWKGSALFNQAQLVVSQPEYDYWNNREIEELASESTRPNFKLAQEVFAVYRNKLELTIPYPIHQPFDDGVEMIEAYGHTIGHTAYLISSDGEQLLICGDLLLSADIQLPYPDVSTVYDMNPSKLARNRRRILSYLADHQVPVAGMHIAYPGIGRVVRNPDTDGYEFIPL